MHIVPKWSDILLKILQQMLQDFLSVSDQFGTLCIKVLRTSILKNISERLLLKIYPLLFPILEDISEETVCPRSTD